MSREPSPTCCDGRYRRPSDPYGGRGTCDVRGSAMRSMTGVVLSAVLALSLSACGSGDKAASSGLPTKKEYCQAARALTGHRPGPATIVEKVQEVGNDSPGEVAGSWHNIVQAVIIYAGVAKKAVRNPAHPPIGL